MMFWRPGHSRSALAAAPVFACLTICAVLISGGATPMLAGAESDAPDSAAVSATLRSRANVRFGPSLTAPEAGVLPAGSAIEILGKAPGAEGWFMIRFPRQCKAWMHEKVLEPIKGGTSFKVIEDKANVRSDATQGSQKVTELNIGDVVESQGQKVGAWYAIYPPTAVAYVSAKLVDLPGSARVAVQQGEVVADRTSRLWVLAQKTYTVYANSSLDSAMTLDWPGLSAQLQDVVDHASSIVIRREAQRLLDGVDRVAAVQADHHFTPSVHVPVLPPDADQGTQNAPTQGPAVSAPVVTGPANELPLGPVQGTGTQANTAPTPSANAPSTPVPTPAPTHGPDKNLTAIIGPNAPAAGAIILEGWPVQRNRPEIGTSFDLMGDNSQPVAYLKLPAGSPIQLSDAIWRLVTVTGTREGTGAANIPVVMVSDLRMGGR